MAPAPARLRAYGPAVHNQVGTARLRKACACAIQRTDMTRTQTALISAAASGIGLAIALGLNADGWRVYCV